MGGARSFLPTPQAAWQLDGHTRSTTGGNPVMLRGRCDWTTGPANHSKALRTGPECEARAAPSASLHMGSGPVSMCARFRSRTPGARLLSKFHTGAAGSLIGFALELGETHGVGVSLADISGISTHLEVGRTVLADGSWHHVCVVLQRRVPATVTLFVDGRHDERVLLEGPVGNLRSIGSSGPLVLGNSDGAIREVRRGVTARTARPPPHHFARSNPRISVQVALWSRALLPEHAKSLCQSGLHDLPPRRPAPLGPIVAPAQPYRRQAMLRWANFAAVPLAALLMVACRTRPLARRRDAL